MDVCLLFSIFIFSFTDGALQQWRIFLHEQEYQVVITGISANHTLQPYLAC